VAYHTNEAGTMPPVMTPLSESLLPGCLQSSSLSRRRKQDPPAVRESAGIALLGRDCKAILHLFEDYACLPGNTRFAIES